MQNLYRRLCDKVTITLWHLDKLPFAENLLYEAPIIRTDTFRIFKDLINFQGLSIPRKTDKFPDFQDLGVILDIHLYICVHEKF